MFLKDFSVDGSSAHGSLVVSFTNGRVSDLTLVTPLRGVALIRSHQGSGGAELIARK
jgi:hypothetical protein